MKVSGGTYSRLLAMAERRKKPADDLGDALLDWALVQQEKKDAHQANQERYLAAETKARQDGRPTPLKRDFGLPE